jgi:hypothetical protein
MSTIEAFVGHCPEIVNQVYGPVEEMAAEAEDFVARLLVLSEDFTKCEKPLKKDYTDQFWRRVMVRNLFVLLEACSYGMKQAALHRHRLLEIDFSNAEIALLSEEKYTLDDGEPKTSKENFQQFVPSLKFAFKCFAKTFELVFALDMTTSPLKEFQRLRNRITHPKKLPELSISDPEVQKAKQVWKWFTGEFQRLMKGMETQPIPMVRAVAINPIKRLFITKPYVVFLPDGYVYQFSTRKQAEAHKREHHLDGCLPPVVLKSADFAGKDS